MEELKKSYQKSKQLSAAQTARAKESAKFVAGKTKVVTGKVAEKNPARGFFDFLREQSVVGLAIGLVLGSQAQSLVNQLINSFINPLIGLLLPGKGTLGQKHFTLTVGDKTQVFTWGLFAISMMTFVVVAAVIYYVFKGLKLDRLDKKGDEADGRIVLTR